MFEIIMDRATEKYIDFQMDVSEKEQDTEMEKLGHLWYGTDIKEGQVQLFSEADANQDGILVLAEYKEWESAMRAQAFENDTWFEADDHSDENYTVFNSINEGNGDGVTELQLYQMLALEHYYFYSLWTDEKK